ncbi:hypothetical protein JOM56_010987 [Amanita muscaria]
MSVQRRIDLNGYKKKSGTPLVWTLEIISLFGFLFYRALFNEYYDECCAEDSKERPTMVKAVQEMEEWISLGHHLDTDPKSVPIIQLMETDHLYKKHLIELPEATTIAIGHKLSTIRTQTDHCKVYVDGKRPNFQVRIQIRRHLHGPWCERRRNSGQIPRQTAAHQLLRPRMQSVRRR